MNCITILITSALCAFSTLATAEQTAQVRAANFYSKGLAAMKAGEADTAEACFREVLRIQPRNANARFQLSQLKLNRPILAAKKRQVQLQEVNVAKIEFEELSLREALGALDELVLRSTAEKFTPNFVVQDPGNLLEQRRFSLRLRNVPASVVLRYCLDHAGASARYDEHVIVVKPLSKSGPTSSGGRK